MHQQHLIHRDIKPSNIIFVRGVPKFADIGLVTEIATKGEEVTYLGTRGYIAPEGPGTPRRTFTASARSSTKRAWARSAGSIPNCPPRFSFGPIVWK